LTALNDAFILLGQQQVAESFYNSLWEFAPFDVDDRREAFLNIYLLERANVFDPMTGSFIDVIRSTNSIFWNSVYDQLTVFGVDCGSGCGLTPLYVLPS